MRVRWPASKGGQRGQAATELGRLMVSHDILDTGALVRALSRAVVHVPMPDAPVEKAPRPAEAADGDVPLFVIDDDDGRHALVYSSPRALVEAWKSHGKITAAAVPVATLLTRWPAGTDMVIDAGLPQAREVPLAVLQQVALDAAGVPTAAAVATSAAGYDVEIPDPEPVQIIGATRATAACYGELQSLWRATARNREPLARDVLTIVAAIDPGVPRERLNHVMQSLAEAISEADPQPVQLLAHHGTDDNQNQQLIDDIRELDAPYWSRSVET